MRIVVQKFGGTSLSTAEGRSEAIRHIRHALNESYRPVVVVSAMGRKGEPYATDTLLDWIERNGNSLPDREKDMLLSCGELISAATLCSQLVKSGITATVFTGRQAGIVTNGKFGNARIVAIHPQPILNKLEKGTVVIVAGFQGGTADGELTTLGRGGSDTTATALGSALRADYVDIFTDVTGVYTADPRIVAQAKQLRSISYVEVCQMALNGAKVIHPRAVEIAMASKTPLRIRSTFTDDEGTWIGEPAGDHSTGTVRDTEVAGIANTEGIAQLSVTTTEHRLDLQLEVFKAMSEHGISIDFINVNPSSVVYTVEDQHAELAVSVLQQLGLSPAYVADCAKIAVIGGGMNGVPGVMAKIVSTLTGLDISILQSSDSHSAIWVLVHGQFAHKAVQALHSAFGLDGEPVD